MVVVCWRWVLESGELERNIFFGYIPEAEADSWMWKLQALCKHLYSIHKSKT